MLKDYLKYKLKYNFLYRKYLKEVMRYYTLSDSEYKSLENELFVKQFQRAYKKSKFYRELYQDNGIKLSYIQSIDDIVKLPVIDKGMIREYVKDIYIGNRFLKISSHTSGTTGSPLTVYRNLKSIALEQAYLTVHRKKHGFETLKDNLISFRGDLLKGQLRKYNKYTKTLFLSGYDINNNELDFYINEFEKFKPKAIEGYPSTLFELATFFMSNNIEFKIPLVFTSSETLYDFQRSLIEDVFSCKLVDWYGNSERTITLTTDVNSTIVELPLYSYNEYSEDYVLTTSFINSDFPLIRYKVDDRIVINNEESEKQQSLVIERIEGRVNDYIILKNGSIVNRLNQAIKSVENIETLQIVQNNYDEIIVNVVPLVKFSESDVAHIKEQINLRTGKAIDIILNKVEMDSILKTKAGKYLLVVNNLMDS